MKIEVDVIVGVTQELARIIDSFLDHRKLTPPPTEAGKQPVNVIDTKKSEKKKEARPVQLDAEQTAVTTDEVTLETIRTKYNQKATNEGKRVELRALLKKFKADELGELDKANYPAFMQELQNL